MKKNKEYEKNLQIATALLQEIKIKDKITSSCDLIPNADLTHFFKGDIEKYNNKFGKERIAEYRKFLSYSHTIRTESRLEAAIDELERTSQPYPNTTALIAVTYCGVGECQDLANLFLLKLIQQGYSGCLGAYLLRGLNPESESYYEHMVGVMGFIGKVTSMDDLKMVGDECLIVDLHQGFIGKANDRHSWDPKYLHFLEHFSLHEFGQGQIVKNPAEIKSLVVVSLKNAHDLSQKWLSELQLTPFKRTNEKDHKLTSLSLFPSPKKSLESVTAEYEYDTCIYLSSGVKSPQTETASVGAQSTSQPQTILKSEVVNTFSFFTPEDLEAYKKVSKHCKTQTQIAAETSLSSSHLKRES